MKYIDSAALDWEKMNDLIPAIIQHALTGDVLMLCYMDKQSLEISQVTNKLTLYSRDKQRLWRKGESSGNTMDIHAISCDDDGDSLLVLVTPSGPESYLGYTSAFQPSATSVASFLPQLASIIEQRAQDADNCSYTNELLQAGVDRCAQKVGEEATETVIAAVQNNPEALIEEASDLLFHLFILLHACNVNLYQLIDCLKSRLTK